MATTPYETLVESAARLTDVDALADIDEANASTAAGLLHRNQGALESARRVLGPKCVVPIGYEEAFFSEQLRSLLAPKRPCSRVSRGRVFGNVQ